MLKQIQKDQAAGLYDYWMRMRGDVPYYLPVDEGTWHASAFEDTDVEGLPLFRELQTHTFMRGGEIAGFIQYGLSSYTLMPQGKDFSRSYGIIRNYHAMPGDEEAARALLLRAMDDLGRVRCEGKRAFFHYFGMTCNARCGKLHQSQFYLEDSLFRAGFRIEHENAWFSKELAENGDLETNEVCFDPPIGRGKAYSSHRIVVADSEIGFLELHYLPLEERCFLRELVVFPQFAHKGYGTRAIKKLAHLLRQQGVSWLDTDTAMTNLPARGFYNKLGFRNEGVMRDYQAK